MLFGLIAHMDFSFYLFVVIRTNQNTLSDCPGQAYVDQVELMNVKYCVRATIYCGAKGAVGLLICAVITLQVLHLFGWGVWIYCSHMAAIATFSNGIETSGSSSKRKISC